MESKQRPKIPSRFSILWMTCLVGLAGNYCFDLPSMIRTEIVAIVERELPGTSDFYFNMMYSIYSLPNIVLPLFMGSLIDRIGFSKPLMITSSLVCLGHMMMWVGMKTESVYSLMFGRLVYGLGGESVYIALGAVLAAWFRGKEISFANIAAVVVGNIASILNCYLSPYLTRYGTAMPHFLGMIVSLASLVASNMIAQFKCPRSPADSLGEEDNENENRTPNALHFCEDIKAIKPIFWAHLAFIIFTYLTILSFNMVASAYFLEVWLIDTLPLQQRIFKVGHWLSFPLVISSIASPLFGIVVDRYGKRIYLLILGTVMLVTSFTMFLSFPPLFPLIFYGIGYSLFTISWGMIPYMVPGKVVGTALGLVSIANNASMTVFPMIIAYIQANSNQGTRDGMITLLIISVIALHCNIILAYIDKKRKVSLNTSDNQALVSAAEGKENEKKEDQFEKAEKAPLASLLEDDEPDEDQNIL